MDASDRVAVMMQGFKEAFTSEDQEATATGMSILDEARIESGQAAQDKYREADYEAALAQFAKQYVVQKMGVLDDELDASLNSNIGACLHHLGEDALAKARAPAHTLLLPSRRSQHSASRLAPLLAPCLNAAPGGPEGVATDGGSR